MLKLRNYCVLLNNQLNLNQLRFQSTAPATAVEKEANSASLSNKEWENAKPFEEIPTIGSFKFLLNFLPGGKYAKLDTVQLFEELRKNMGDIAYLPGFFGNKGSVITHNVDDFEKVLRNEGVWPNRPGAESLEYHRHVHRADFFQGIEGLISTQGETWGSFRSVVNPVMMQPKTIRLYMHKMSQVGKEYVERIRQIRDPQTLEVPENFKEETNRYTLESVSVVALDKQLGLINKNRDNPLAKGLFQGLNDFFTYSLEVDFKPSIWKYYKTPTFKKLMKAYDEILEITNSYVNDAIERLEEERKSGVPEKPEHEKSVLEKLIKIDKRIAVVMAMDMLMAGVDSTTTTFSGFFLCMAKNPEKQEKLRQEILKVLPQKDSEFDENAMKNMPYLRACIKESLRIYPFVLGNSRIPVNDVIIGGYRVPKHTKVVMCATSLNCNSKYYYRPNEFLPQRWLRANQETGNTSECPQDLRSSNPFLHLPFGFGPRSCIGRRIVEMELELGICRVLRNFRIEFNYPTENAFKSMLIFVPNIPLKFKFTDLNY